MLQDLKRLKLLGNYMRNYKLFNFIFQLSKFKRQPFDKII
jgi:hypothetical protein